MKTIIFSLLVALSTNLFAQTKDSTRNYYLNIEISLIHPLLGGFGATVGLEKKHFSLGLMAYRIELNHMLKHYLMEGAEELTVFNWGVELYSDYYLKKSHKGLFFGTLLSFNGYRFNDIPVPQTILALYVAPRIGYRIYLPKKLKKFYFQPAVSLQIMVWDNADKFLYQEIDLNSGFLLSQLTLGMKI